jgi:hypothetical protein
VLGNEDAVAVRVEILARRERSPRKTKGPSTLTGSILATPLGHCTECPNSNMQLAEFWQISDAPIYQNARPTIARRQARQSTTEKGTPERTAIVNDEDTTAAGRGQGVSNRRVVVVYAKGLDGTGKLFNSAEFPKQRPGNLNQFGKCVTEICSCELHLWLRGWRIRSVRHFGFQRLHFSPHLQFGWYSGDTGAPQS